jgi:cytochrome c oxidase cbb3-type subunit 2
VVPESIMPTYAFMAERRLEPGDMRAHLTAQSRVGVPYTQAAIDAANDDLRAQADPAMSPADLQRRYPGAQARDFDGDPETITEMDALIAYLQMLGTMVDTDAAAAQEQPR